MVNYLLSFEQPEILVHHPLFMRETPATPDALVQAPKVVVDATLDFRGLVLKFAVIKFGYISNVLYAIKFKKIKLRFAMEIDARPTIQHTAIQSSSQIQQQQIYQY